PDPGVRGDRDEHRPRGREDLELEDGERDGLELGEERGERGERGDDLAAELAPAPLGLDRLVIANGLGLVERVVRLLLGRELAHRLIVAAGGRHFPTSLSEERARWRAPRRRWIGRRAARGSRRRGRRAPGGH